MFEQASRIQLRFSSSKGLLTVEDLWCLPLTSNTGKVNLDDIAMGLYNQLNQSKTQSFVNKDVKPDETIQLSFDIVKHIIDVRLAENEASNKAKVRAEQKQQLLALINQREGEQLANLSLEELRAKVAEL